jgi:hypothetical protein
LGQGIGDANEALEKFRHLGNGAVLFGTKQVADAVTAVVGEYVDVFREARKRSVDKPITPADVRKVFDERIKRIHEAPAALLEAMRADVEPK